MIQWRWMALVVMCLIVCVATSPRLVFAQNQQAKPLPPGTSINAYIDNQNVYIGDRIRYTIAVDGSVFPDKVTFPPFKREAGLELLTGPEESTAMSIDNGVSRARKTYVFNLQAHEKGTITIPAATIVLNGYPYQTQSVTINVQDVPEGKGDLKSVISARTNITEINDQLDGRYLAMMKLPKRAYPGQAVPVDIFVYRDPALPEFVGWELSQAFSGDEFIIPDNINRQMVSNRLSTWESIKFGDKNFLRIKIYTGYVIPSRSGDLLLTPPSIGVALPTRSSARRDPFQSMFRTNNSVKAEMVMRAAKMKVLPLPDKPAEALEQIVGDRVSVEVSVDRDKILRRELVRYTIQVTGAGFFDLLSQPQLPEIANLTLVDKTVESASNVLDGKFVAMRKFDYVFQAVDAGDIEIPELSFAVFDVEAGTQDLVKTNPIPVKIQPDNSQTVQIGGVSSGEAGGSAARPVDRANARELGNDIAHIDTSMLTATGVVNRRVFYLQPWFWLVQLLPVALCLGYGIITVRNRGERTESASTRTKRGRKIAQGALEEARKKKSNASRDEFYATISRGIYQFVANVLGQSAGSLTIDEATENLKARGCTEDVCGKLESILNGFDAARYSPKPETPDERDQAIKDAEDIIVSLDREVQPA